MMQKKEKLKISLMTAGAFISYNVGAGFASGNEILQFFACWDFVGVIKSLLCGCLTTILFCVVIFKLGDLSQTANVDNAYVWIAGPVFGRLFRLFTDIMVISCFMLMFSGASNVLNQQFMIPDFIGALILGILTLCVSLGGLKRVESVLGYAGIIILVYITIFSVYTLIGTNVDIQNVNLIPTAVEKGIILRANIFQQIPILQKLSKYNSPEIEGILYATQCIIAGFPFYLELGKSKDNEEKSTFKSVLSAITFYLCISFVVVILIFNFQSIIDPITGKMYAFPTLAAINYLWHKGSFTYSILIFIGIFSTTVGYLWVISDRFFPKGEKTKKNNIFIVSMVLIGMILGKYIPFSKLINFLFPMIGIIGLFMLCICCAKLLHLKITSKK